MLAFETTKDEFLTSLKEAETEELFSLVAAGETESKFSVLTEEEMETCMNAMKSNAHLSTLISSEIDERYSQIKKELHRRLH